VKLLHWVGMAFNNWYGFANQLFNVFNWLNKLINIPDLTIVSGIGLPGGKTTFLPLKFFIQSYEKYFITI
jgi:hypothetical protein